MATVNELPTSQPRNYNTISPSARSLLLLKGYTPIPFAREAARLIQYPEPYTPDFSIRQPGFWARVGHFEARYWSIDQLLTDLLLAAASPGILNILELSSGFSFRGLALAAEHPVYYIDTDLPEVIDTKQQLVASLTRAEQSPAGTNAANPAPRGHYELRPLNALDETAFNDIVDSFAPGPLVIVNEGLLMYLGLEEKRRLGALIRKTLLQRGGYWITADIYLKRSQRREEPELAQGDTLRQFLEQHKVEENMFNSFEEATELFTSMGFAIDKEAQPDFGKLSSMPHFLASVSPDALQRLQQRGKIHATWRLRPTP